MFTVLKGTFSLTLESCPTPSFAHTPLIMLDFEASSNHSCNFPQKTTTWHLHPRYAVIVPKEQWVLTFFSCEESGTFFWLIKVCLIFHISLCWPLFSAMMTKEGTGSGKMQSNKVNVISCLENWLKILVILKLYTGYTSRLPLSLCISCLLFKSRSHGKRCKLRSPDVPLSRVSSQMGLYEPAQVAPFG